MAIKKTLICIDGIGPRPGNQILYVEDQGKVVNNERIKHIIVEREIRSEDEAQNKTLELVRIELNQKQAAIFWAGLWRVDYEKCIHIDATNDPNVGIYIAKKSSGRLDPRWLVFTKGRLGDEGTQALARITLTAQRGRRMKDFLLEDWSISPKS
jgi:hypothetical protein